MRVIAGSARRIQLKTPGGMDTRPTTDRIKETLFNMLSPYLFDCCFLDLFAGSGGIGIEALSRGAAAAVFVENSRRAAACIRENLKHTRLGERAEVVQADAVDALARLEGEWKFDFIFMDPPYGQGQERRILDYLSEADLLSDEGIVIAEALKETNFEFAEESGFIVLKEKLYKTNKHVFLEPAERQEIC